MTVTELIEALQKYSKQYPNAEVILQRDSEGNGYSPLAGVDEGLYVPDNSWMGLFYDKSWSPSDCCMDEDEYEELHKTPTALVLFPLR